MANFRIEPTLLTNFGGLKARAEANLRAIRLLKKIEAEKRPATDDEKSILVRYTGWGALPQVFSWSPGKEWDGLRDTLYEELTSDERTSAQESVNNAHYTAVDVIEAMWSFLTDSGLVTASPTVLEPGAGIGHFVGLMPLEIASTANTVAVEIDSLSARLIAALYPDIKTVCKPFQETQFVDGFFDLVIGNVPFGKFPVHDSRYKKNKALTASIHDYFIARSLDLTKEGGIVALITSRYTLDKLNGAVREYYASKANLIGALRLPNGTFRDNAVTNVVTDVLFFQRTNTPEKNPIWIQPAVEVKFPQLTDRYYDNEVFAVNPYFIKNPQFVLGQAGAAVGGGMYGHCDYTVDGEFDANLFARATHQFTMPSERIVSAPSPAVQVFEIDEDCKIKIGGFGHQNGKLVQRLSATEFKKLDGKGSTVDRITGLMQIRDVLRRVFASQLDENSNEKKIVQLRTTLNMLYDMYISDYGKISDPANRKAYGSDPDYLLLRSLETPDGGKADVFFKRTIYPAQNITSVADINEALLVALNEKGVLDWSRIASLVGKTVPEVQCELAARNLVFRNPQGGTYVISDDYLSGDVRKKLFDATVAAEINPAFTANVSALVEVQPKHLLAEEIEVRLGAPWIPTDVVKDFVAHLFEASSWSTSVSHSAEIATWTVDLDAGVKGSARNQSIIGTSRVTGLELIEDILNGRNTTIYDKDEDDKRIVNQDETVAAREKAQGIKDKFKVWAFEDETRMETLCEIYNTLYNSTRLRDFNGLHLTFPGMSRSWLRSGELEAHQKSAVWRILQSPATLLGHAVGSGKSFVMAAAGMEAKRIGFAKKPLYVVPNHLVDQWAEEFLKVYPQANLFIVNKDSFGKGKRELAMSRIATGNYDAVIMSHRSFEFLPVSDDMYKSFIRQELDTLEFAIRELKGDDTGYRSRHSRNNSDTRMVKRLEAAKKRLKVKWEKLANKEAKDQTLIFEELGVDMLFVDESDAFKNLGFVTKMQRIAGIPNTESLRAFDMFMKCRYLLTHKKQVVFATGTPISNTIAEMFTLMRYLHLERINELGLNHFDAWAASFAESVTGLELAPDGSGYRVHTRFSRFINVPELVNIFRSFAEIKTAKMLALPTPTLETGKPIVASVQVSAAQKEYIASLVERADKLRTEKVDPRDDNMLNITTDGRKVALDIRLVDAWANPDQNTKVDVCASNVARIWKETAQQLSAQMVFLDISTPNKKDFNVYDDLKAKLVLLGVSASDIAYIHEADSDEAKLALFEKVNAGKVRIIMGSTEKMGSGTNAQRRLFALHHLDAPWRPRDIEQREGRILRPGNMNATVKIFRYVTSSSFDAYMWQTMETKFRFISQVICGESTARQIEDLESTSLTYAEVKAIASGNPMVMEKVRVDAEVRKLESLYSVHERSCFGFRRQLVEAPNVIARQKEIVKRIASDIEVRNSNTALDEAGNPLFSVRIGNTDFTNRDEAAAALQKVVVSWMSGNTEAVDMRAIFRGFKVYSGGSQHMFVTTGFLQYPTTFSNSATGTLQSIEYTIKHLDARLDTERVKLEEFEKSIIALQKESVKPFEHLAKLKALRVRQQEIDAAFDLDKSDKQAIALEAVELPEEAA